MSTFEKEEDVRENEIEEDEEEEEVEGEREAVSVGGKDFALNSSGEDFLRCAEMTSAELAAAFSASVSLPGVDRATPPPPVVPDSAWTAVTPFLGPPPIVGRSVNGFCCTDREDDDDASKVLLLKLSELSSCSTSPTVDSGS